MVEFHRWNLHCSHNQKSLYGDKYTLIVHIQNNFLYVYKGRCLSVWINIYNIPTPLQIKVKELRTSKQLIQIVKINCLKWKRRVPKTTIYSPHMGEDYRLRDKSSYFSKNKERLALFPARILPVCHFSGCPSAYFNGPWNKQLHWEYNVIITYNRYGCFRVPYRMQHWHVLR